MLNWKIIICVRLIWYQLIQFLLAILPDLSFAEQVLWPWVNVKVQMLAFQLWNQIRLDQLQLSVASMSQAFTRILITSDSNGRTPLLTSKRFYIQYLSVLPFESGLPVTLLLRITTVQRSLVAISGSTPTHYQKKMCWRAPVLLAPGQPLE